MKLFFLSILTSLLLVVGCSQEKHSCESDCACELSTTKKSTQPSKTVPPSPASDIQKKDIVATIGDTIITVDYVQEQMERQMTLSNQRFVTLDSKRKFVDNLIVFETLALEADKQGFSRDVDAVHAMKKIMVQKFLLDSLQKKLHPDDLTDKELRTFYNDHQKDYQQTMAIQVLLYLMKNKKDANKAHAAVKKLDPTAHVSFKTIMEKHGAKQLGRTPRYIRRDDTSLPPSIIKAIFTLRNIGDTQGPIAADEQLFFIRKTGLREGKVRSFSSVKRQLRNRLYREQRQKNQETLIKQLQTKTPVERFDDQLKTLSISNPPIIRPKTTHGH